jgi:predicted branched-subunit amino acid permease
MPTTTKKSAFWKGFRDGAPFVIIVAPFAALFGVLAIEAGLNVLETMMFSVAVFAGAAQFTALQLIQEQAPTVVVLLSALAVNLRVAMYSAALTPYLGGAPMWQRVIAAYFTVDQSYALSVSQFEAQPAMTLPERMAYFTGTLTLIVPTWYASSFAGALLGARIPEAWVPDFALPICFLAMVGPMIRTGAHMVAALVAVVAGLLFATMPYSLGLIIASVLGMMAGAQTETWMIKRGKWT